MIEQKIREIINNSDFIYLDDFIKICHQDKSDGYYRRKEMIGIDGDFITSPEISQLFGEAVSLCFLDQILKENIKKFNLIELGPGRGTLLKDLNRTFKTINNKFDYTIHTNEINNNYLKQIKAIYPKCINHTEFNNYPANYSAIVANEFFDALPIRQVIMKNLQIQEIGITLDRKEKLIFDHFQARDDTKHFMARQTDLKEGQIYEFSPDTNKILDDLCRFLKKHRGHLLIFDYGFLNTSYADTLQSLYKNKKSNLLDNIGYQDITYHINFHELKTIIKKFEPRMINLCSQSKFLERNGIHERASDLIKRNPSQRDNIENQVHRLTNKKEMGELFKVLEVLF